MNKRYFRAFSIVIVFLTFSLIYINIHIEETPEIIRVGYLSDAKHVGNPSLSETKQVGDLGETKQCKKVQKIGFAKLHKCASTSIHNILVRYAIINDLNVVLPNQTDSKGYFDQDYKELFSSSDTLQGDNVRLSYRFRASLLWMLSSLFFLRKWLANAPWEEAGLEYHIFCLHARWNQAEISATLGEGAKYFTMLRHPVNLAVSLWDYGIITNTWQGLRALEEVIQAIKNGDENSLDVKLFKEWIGNRMLYDLGLNYEDMKNESAIETMTKQVDQNFNIILIVERFEESLILLKELLCWDYRDIENLLLNGTGENTRAKLTEDSIKWLGK